MWDRWVIIAVAGLIAARTAFMAALGPASGR
jgi:hypothetical protein